MFLVIFFYIVPGARIHVILFNRLLVTRDLYKDLGQTCPGTALRGYGIRLLVGSVIGLTCDNIILPMVGSILLDILDRLSRIVCHQVAGLKGVDDIGEADDVGPVSYTHLDVYKRQVLHGRDAWRLLVGLALAFVILAAVNPLFDTLGAVSYTHLDVYKRQKEALPEDLIFWVSYLGGEEATMAINFSRSASQIIGQYYVFMRKDVYKRQS